MRVGFTGTQLGMSPSQKMKLTKLLNDILPTEFHHGDCIGADAEASDIAWQLGIARHSHPPTDPKKRAFKPFEIEYPTKPYLLRNLEIVSHSDLLIVAPRSDKEELRSGTWATKRYAESIGLPFIILER